MTAAGLHPSVGVHHANRGDAFPLADDLTEPPGAKTTPILGVGTRRAAAADVAVRGG